MAIDEQITPAAAAQRALIVTNPSGGAGAPIVMRHGIAAADGSQIGIPGAPLTTTPNKPSLVFTGQVKIVTTGVAVQLPDHVLTNGIVIKSLATNSASMQTIGPSGVTNAVDGTGNGYIMAPGEASSFAVPNANLLYVNGTAGDVFTYEGN